MTMLKDLKMKGVTYQKVLTRVIISWSMDKSYDHPIDSDVKWYEEIRKSTIAQGEEKLLDVCWIMIT